MDHRHQNVTIKTKKHIEENVQENVHVFNIIIILPILHAAYFT